MPASLNNSLANEYRLLFDTCIINEDRFAEIDKTVLQMLQNKMTYDNVAGSTNVPWNFIAIIHCMEGSLSFKTHLHNGDPLTARTVHVPKGRPVSGKPPFSWEESATDALTVEGFTSNTDWSIPGMLFSFERFNGMGYRKKGINSPYLWSYSNQYSEGKFTDDGVFDPHAVSRQCGAAVLLRRMSEKQVAVTGEVDTITMIKNLGAEVLFDPDHFNEKASQLQMLLNIIGQHLRLDGKAGINTSNAYHAVSGKFLQGDDR